jgi:hypothetical protein
MMSLREVFVCVARETSEVLFDHPGWPDHRASLPARKASLNDKTSEVWLCPKTARRREVFVCVARKALEVGEAESSRFFSAFAARYQDLLDQIIYSDRTP